MNTAPAIIAPQTGKAVTAVAATDLFTSAGHGFIAGEPVVFSGLTGGAGLTAGQTYYVIAANLTTNNFQVSATFGGSTIDLTTDLTAGTVTKLFSFFTAKQVFNSDDLAYLAGFVWRSQGVPATDGVLISGADLRSLYERRSLPL